MKTTVAIFLTLQLWFVALREGKTIGFEGHSVKYNLKSGLEDQPSWLQKVSERPPLNVSVNNGYHMNDQICPQTNTWFVWDNKTKSCHCGDDLSGIVQCNRITKQISIMDCYCLTNMYTMNGPARFSVVGKCIFNCANSTQFIMYHSAPSDCASLNRQGTLCGQCLDGYTVPAYSYKLKCIRCDSELENWGLYIVFAFVPLTVFIVIILVFRINVLSPKLNMFVLAAQNLSVPVFLRIILYILSQTKSKAVNIPVKLLFTLYGIWNLDFFRVNVLPDICINVVPLHILVLDYLIAIYPMLLMAVAYTIVELHASGFRPLLYMWKPFHYFFARFRRQWGIQTTIMDAFVTFFFLSTTKLLSVSFGLLIATELFTNDGKLYSWNLYYDPSIKFFGREHLPYALLAISILTVFIAFPTSLLLFYQCKVFHKCLEKFRIRDSMLNGFVFNFQKYYKDGSNGTWDCRWFAGFFIIIKSLGYITYALSPAQFNYILLILLCIIGAAVIVIVEPYKEEYKVFNIIGPNLLLWLAVFFATLFYHDASSISQKLLNGHFISTAVLSLFPLFYIIVVIIHHLIRRFRGEKREDGSISSLPHRLLHSDQYRGSSVY